MPIDFEARYPETAAPEPRWFQRLVQFFKAKPKPPTYKVICSHCGKEGEMFTPPDPTKEYTHNICQIAINAMEKAKAEVERKRREQIEIVKTALRELESEKLNTQIEPPTKVGRLQ